MLATRIDRPEKIALAKIDTRQDGGLDKDNAEKRLAELGQRLFDLQELMYAAGQNALLVVLQGRDTSGKDGTLKAVAGAMNPVGVNVASFKSPTPLELGHDFLWRVHAQTPAIGQAVFFNRSHYEDVLIVRVRNFAPKNVWEKRYAHINHFEELLADSGVIIAKFCLHISKDEQEERLLEREKEPEKAWKLNPGDWEERKYWDEYTSAYEDALGKCASPHAPWFIVPSDRKWFRNLAVAEALVETLVPYEPAWRERLEQIGKTQRAALAQMRESDAASPR